MWNDIIQCNNDKNKCFIGKICFPCFDVCGFFSLSASFLHFSVYLRAHKIKLINRVYMSGWITWVKKKETNATHLRFFFKEKNTFWLFFRCVFCAHCFIAMLEFIFLSPIWCLASVQVSFWIYSLKISKRNY